MKLPSEITNWLEYKYESDCSSIYNSSTVIHEYKKQTGGMVIYAGISLSISPSKCFELLLPDLDIEESYYLGVKDGIISSLFVINEKPLLNIKISVTDMKTTFDGSSYFAFYNVAREAMVKANDQLYT